MSEYSCIVATTTLLTSNKTNPFLNERLGFSIAHSIPSQHTITMGYPMTNPICNRKICPMSF